MSFKKNGFAFAILSFLPLRIYSTCLGVPQTWTGVTDQTWNTTTNWSGTCVPGTGAVTDTETVTFATPGGGGGSISLNVPSGVGLGSLTFNNGSTSYTISSSPADRFIQFNGASSVLSVLAGSHTISSPVNVNNTTLHVTIASGSTLTNEGVLVEAVGSTSSLIFDGAGQFINNPAVGGQGVSIKGLITQSSGSVLNQNTTASAVTGSFFQATQGFTIQGGSYTQQNSGAITAAGSGCVSNTATGTFTLTSGAVSNINSGSVASNLGSTGSFLGYGGILFNGGTFSNTNSGPISGSNAIGAAIVSLGSIAINGGDLSNTNSGDCSGSGIGVVILGSAITMNGGTLTLSNSGNISGTLNTGSVLSSGTTLTMNGGTLINTANTGTLTGTNTFGSLIQAISSIAINGGTLINHDTVLTPAITLGTSGNLAGQGSFNTPSLTNLIAIANSGTVTPGNPGVGASNPGTMTIHGSYTQLSSGKLIVNLLNSSTFSQLNIDGTLGTAQLAGTLQVGLSPGATVSPGDIYTIVQTTNGVTGTFAEIINSTLSLTPQVTYLANTVEISFTPTLGPSLTSFTETLLSSVNEINTRLSRQMMRLRGRFASSKLEKEIARNTQFIAARQNFQVDSPKERVDSHLPWDIYFGPTGNFGRLDSKGTQTGFDYWSAGALAGFDYAFSQAGVGFLFNYDHIAGHKSNTGRFTLDEAHGSLYGTYTPILDFALNAIVGGSYEWYQMRRAIGPGLHDAIGNPDGGEFDSLLGIEYTFSRRKFQNLPKALEITPFASLQYIYLTVGEYTEKEAGLFDLHIKNQNVESLRSTLGGRLNYTWQKNASAFPNLTMILDLAWQREYLDHNRSIGFSPIAFVQPSSTLIAPGAGRNFVLAGIDFLAKISEKYGFEASYDFQWNEIFLDHNFYLGFDMKF